ncbi:hypothetical protein THOG11_100033 [Vibrio harveyi]|nr:hypothetical protein TH15OA1_110191 [Vibrio harveyi]CAH1550424.1 hypothetical protein THOG11_100033 [Vibrio harveyi]CAH1582596.1 hypothetical protein THOD03_80033 [Vibrio harveyi]
MTIAELSPISLGTTSSSLFLKSWRLCQLFSIAINESGLIGKIFYYLFYQYIDSKSIFIDHFSHPLDCDLCSCSKKNVT